MVDERSAAEAEARLTRYIAQARTESADIAVAEPDDPPARALLKRYGRRIQLPLRVTATNALRPRERRRAARAAAKGPLKLHLGSGREPKIGWTNVDLFGDPWHPVDVAWNLKVPLPFDPDSVEAIFHEHLLEHLPLEAGVALHRQCYRLLRPGGVLRLGVPDAGAYVRSYVDGGRGMIDDVRPGRPTPLLALQELFYWHEHRTMYDFETLELVLRAAGFDEIEPRGWGDSRLDPAPDTKRRRPESLYVETVKP